MTGPEDLDEWSLAGLTREQGLARWAAVFAVRLPVSRMTVSTCWGWLAWEAADAETAQLARLASRTPTPVLVQIAVRDPDSRARWLSTRPSDPVTAGAWTGLSGLVAGGAAGVWWWGIGLLALVSGVATAVVAVAVAALWQRLIAARRPTVRILTERDGPVADVFAGARVLTWVTDHLRIHRAVITAQPARSGMPTEDPPEFAEAVDQLHRALWALATGRADDPRATLVAMTEYAGLVIRLIDARERVLRASTVRVAPPAPAPRVTEPVAERLREAGRRLDDAIKGQQHAATVIDDINRRFDETT